MMKRYTPGFALNELSTQSGMLGALFLAGMEVMPESWKPWFVVLLTLVFVAQMAFKRKPDPDLVPRHDIPDQELPDDVQDLIDMAKR